MEYTRLVPLKPHSASPPYCSLISESFWALVSKASSQLMRTQPGSASVLGLVRFMG